ncbi:MAG: DUF1365 domain-containing protein [Betaproteobacteria bacterium]|nr:DUF1365 domain-containing protein [Betaproteobacteria bacterium]
MGQALLGVGDVLHTRVAPRVNAFRYGVYFLLLPMRSGFASTRWLGHNRAAPLSFHDGDHGDGQRTGLDWVEQLLRGEGIDDADGEIWLQCFPRVLGYVFKPVSFWFCHRADGSLRCVVAEVNNTFGERHAYLLDLHRPLRWGETLQARKVFHVSPFCEVSGDYRFRFLRTRQGDVERLVIRIDYSDANGPLLQTSISGSLQPATDAAVRRAFWRMPLMTFGVIARIHLQAVRLWFKRVPFHRKPAAPGAFVTRDATALDK